VSPSARLSRPRFVIGLLIAACALIAVFSIARTSGSDSVPASPEATPPFDPTKLTTIHPKDGIPTLDDPSFESVASADWLNAREPVVAVRVGSKARAYPLRILMWHEIVNDSIDGRPIAVTYCPLCSSAVAFARPRLESRPASFGTSGRLYRSNLVMYDRTTDSLWPQLTGLAIRGEMAGSELLRLPVVVVSWNQFRAAFPEGRVLSEDTGFDRPYGENPYPGFDTDAAPPSEVEIDVDPRLPARDRVLGVRADEEVIAFSFARLAGLERQGAAVANEMLGGRRIAIFWRRGTVSALDDKKIVGSRDVGSAAAYLAELGTRALSFRASDGRIVDAATGSTWDIFGTATSGPLEGRQLATVDVIEAFWYQWAAFHPKTEVWSAEE
jgi:Protein of unknown function (DUF3179)